MLKRALKQGVLPECTIKFNHRVKQIEKRENILQFVCWQQVNHMTEFPIRQSTRDTAGVPDF